MGLGDLLNKGLKLCEDVGRATVNIATLGLFSGDSDSGSSSSSYSSSSSGSSYSSGASGASSNIYWWNCQHCGMLIRQAQSPASNGCTASVHGHWWFSLGKVGNINYSCRHCGITIFTESDPGCQGCIANSRGHSWIRL